MSGILAETRGPVGLAQLNRPDARNALSPELMEELAAMCERWDEDPGIRCIVIAGSDEWFAAGADIKAMAEFGPDEVRPSVDALGAACDLLEDTPKVSIAAVNGFALGGGLELALACDLRYLADDAKVGQPEVRLGVIPGAGGTQRLVPLVGAGRTRELVYTGRQVDAHEAVAIGLGERIVPADQVFDAAMTDARRFARGPREALAAAKRAIRMAVLSPGPDGIRAERMQFLRLFGTPDQREGMRAFLEKREPTFGGPVT